MSIVSADKELTKLYRKEKYLTNTWTAEEQVLRNRPKTRDLFLEKHTVPFNRVINEVVRKSFFGIFLKHFNPQHDQNKQFNEDKWAIHSYHLKSLELPKRKLAESKNRFTEEFQETFLDAIKCKDVIDWDYLYERMHTLRLLSYEMNLADKRMKEFANLQVLVLSGNWIRDLDGRNLPRKLAFLELYANQIEKLDKLCSNPPKSLKYLGLGRNCLHDDSGYHHLAESKNLTQLKCIDFSDNDIYNLRAVVYQLSRLHNLDALSLEGNPCWVIPIYKRTIMQKLRSLRILDNAEFLESDKKDDVFEFLNISHLKPALVFNCFRILALPPPPKEKGALSFFHVEVSLPLLEEVVIQPKINEGGKEGSRSKTATKAKSKTKSDNSKGKKGKILGIYDGRNEYEKEKNSRVKNVNFKTERKAWDKVIEFPEITIESPENDMKAIRDCFRSRINIKVIYQLVEPPQKAKKGKKDKKNKKDKKKDKTGKRTEDGITNKIPATSEAAIVEKEPEETILKKVTIANFFCDLRQVNWSDDSVDFYWANHPKANPAAIPVEGSLKALNYQAKVSGKGKEKGKGKADEKETETNEEIRKATSDVSTKISKIGEIEPVGFPSIFTCQVGFGLRRCSQSVGVSSDT